MPLPKDIDQHLKGEFLKGSLASVCLSPFACCTFCLCQPCSLFTQRRRILRVTGEPYVMCGGVWPCCGFEQPSPDCLLVCEVCMCAPAAMAGNRLLVQTRFDKKNTGMDNFLQCFQCCVGLEFACMRLCCTCSKERENLVKAAVCVCPITHCQNAYEIRAMESGGKYTAPPAGVIGELPVHFGNVGISIANAPTQMAPM